MALYLHALRGFGAPWFKHAVFRVFNPSSPRLLLAFRSLSTPPPTLRLRHTHPGNSRRLDRFFEASGTLQRCVLITRTTGFSRRFDRFSEHQARSTLRLQHAHPGISRRFDRFSKHQARLLSRCVYDTRTLEVFCHDLNCSFSFSNV